MTSLPRSTPRPPLLRLNRKERILIVVRMRMRVTQWLAMTYPNQACLPKVPCVADSSRNRKERRRKRKRRKKRQRPSKAKTFWES